MAEEIEENTDITPEPETVEEVETPEQTQEIVEGDEQIEPTVEESDDVVVTIGEESPPHEETEAAPEWVKELRKSNRETAKENRLLKEQLKAKESTETKPVELGAKPTLESCDYDEAVLESQMSSWFERKREHEEVEQGKQAEQKKHTDAWNSKLEDYGTAKTNLKVKDFDEAEEVVLTNLSETQQAIIVNGADNSALLVYALGKNPVKAKELSLIKDPVKFAFAVAKMETTLKVNKRKAPPKPETKVSGTGSNSGAVDSHLTKLREDAAKSGNHSKVIAYKKQLKNKK